MTPSGRLSKNIVNRILTGRFGALHQSFAETNFFDFIRFYAVLTYVVHPILRPDKFVDRHPPILRERVAAGNASAERLPISGRPKAGPLHRLVQESLSCCAMCNVLSWMTD